MTEATRKALKQVDQILQESGWGEPNVPDQELVLQAGQKLTLTVGGSHIEITSSGIAIDGSRINFKGSGPSAGKIESPQEPAKPA